MRLYYLFAVSIWAILFSVLYFYVSYDFVSLLVAKIFPSFHIFDFLFKSTEIRLMLDIFLGALLMGVVFFIVFALPFFKSLSKHSALPLLFSFPVVFALISANERMFDIWLYSSTYKFFMMVFVLLGVFKLFNIVND